MLVKSKKLFKIILATLMLLAICFPMYSCSMGEKRGNNHDIMDSYGRDVSCPKIVNRIATVGSATRYVVYAGAIDKLCAITEMDRPTELRPYTLVDPDLFSTLPTTNRGNHLNENDVDKEKLIELQPDIIISSRSADECQELQDATKIPVIGIYSQDEIMQTSVWAAIQTVSWATDTEDIANTKVGQINKLYSDINSLCTGEAPSIYRGAINFKGSKDITGTISQYSPYKAIKANNVSDIEDYSGAYDTSLEQILSWNPDIVVVDCNNKEKVSKNISENPEVFSNLKAFKNKQVYFSGPFNNNGTNVEYGLCEMFMTAKILYPSVFANLNLEQKYCEIVQILLGKDLYPEIKARGIVFGKADF